MRFDEYVERCLYDPEAGFYRSGAGVAGRRRGDFVTSPEVGPLFADVLGRFLDQAWVDLGCPDPYRIHDAGTGPGTLARQLAAQGRDVVGFDRAHGDELPVSGVLEGAVVVANELLDNIPFRIVEGRAGGWYEVHVAAGADGAARIEELVPISLGEGSDPHLVAVLDRLARAGVEPLDGVRVPIQEGAAHWVRDVLAAGPALVVAFDYGASTTAELVERGGWLRTYRQHEVGTDPLVEPGSYDITTDVALDQLPPPDEVTDQASFLRRWGIDELVEEGRRHWAEHAAHPDLAAIRMRSRVSEAEALLDPTGLGSWLVCTWGSSPAG